MNTSSTQGRPRLPVRCCQVDKALGTSLSLVLEWSHDISGEGIASPVRALLRILLFNIIEYTNFS